MLDTLGLLNFDTALATVVRITAFVLMAASLAGMAWVLWTIAHQKRF
jgi:hypothetical protein